MANAGEPVELQGQVPDHGWYKVRTRQGIEGWMSATLLAVNGDVTARVPVDSTNWDEVAPIPTVTPVPPPPADIPQAPAPVGAQPAIQDSRALAVTKVATIQGPEAVYVVGVAKNTTDQPISNISVSAALLTSDGSIAGQDDTNISGFDAVPPRGTFPFFVLIDLPGPGWTHAQVQLGGTVGAIDSGRMSPYLDLIGEATEARPSVAGYDVSGRIRNVGSGAAQYVSYVVIAYDAAGNILDMEPSMVTGTDSIPAGSAAVFQENLLYLRQRPARIQVLAEGHVPY